VFFSIRAKLALLDVTSESVPFKFFVFFQYGQVAPLPIELRGEAIPGYVTLPRILTRKDPLSAHHINLEAS